MAVHFLHRPLNPDVHMIHSKFLGYFDAVARQGSIRRAAAVLNVCSTTVTRKLKDVERDLGVKLLDRTPDGVVLTAAGSIVVEHCRKTLYDFEQLRAVVDDIRSARSGHIQLMVIDSAALGLVPDVLRDFSADYPGVTYSVTTGQPDEIVDAVAEGAVDIGLSFSNENHPSIRSMFEKAAPIGAVMRSDHPLAERAELTIGDLENYLLVRSIDGRGHHSLLDEAIAGATASLSTKVFTDSLPIAKKTIEGGQVIGLYTKLGFRDEIDAGALRYLPVANDFLKSLSVGILISAKRSLSPMEHMLATQIGKALTRVQLDY